MKRIEPMRRVAGLVVAGFLAGCAGTSAATDRAAASDPEQTDMTEKNKQTIQQFVQAFKNESRHEIVDELFAEDFVHHFPDPRLPPGREGLKTLGKTVATAFPDVHVEIERLVAEDDYVVERTRAEATHRGEFAGVPATGNTVRWTELHLYRFRDGKVVEHWPEVNMLAILTQIGAVPAPG